MGELAKFGVDRIDMMLEGIPRGSVILVEENNEELSSFPSGYLCARFLHEGLSRGEYGVAVLTEHMPSWYLNQVALIGIDLRQYRSKGSLKVVDAFTSLTGRLPSPEDSEADVVISSPGYASELTSKLQSLYAGLGDKIARARTVVDSLSTTIYMMGFADVWKIVLSAVAKIGVSGQAALLILYPQMHESKEVAALERIVDGILEFRGERTKSSIEYTFRIKKMRGVSYNSESVRYFKSEGSLTFE